MVLAQFIEPYLLVVYFALMGLRQSMLIAEHKVALAFYAQQPDLFVTFEASSLVLLLLFHLLFFLVELHLRVYFFFFNRSFRFSSVRFFVRFSE